MNARISTEELELYQASMCYTFLVETDSQLRFELTSNDLNSNFTVEIYDNNYNNIATYHDETFFNLSIFMDGQHEFAKGQYYLIIRRIDRFNTSSPLSYTLIIHNDNLPSDSYEDNNSFTKATRIAPNKSIQGSINNVYDIDYYMLELNSDYNVFIKYLYNNLPDYCDYKVTIYDQNYNKITDNISKKSSFYGKALKAGIYYIVVSNPSNGNYSEKFYELNISVFDLAPDSNENNNTFSNATALQIPTEITASIHNTNDKDYYKFTLSNAQYVQLLLTDIPFDCNYDLYLYDQNYKLITESKSQNNSSEFIEEYLEAGTYFAKVDCSESSGCTDDSYTLYVDNALFLDYIYDQNNSIAEAKTISSSCSIIDTIQFEKDKDYYKITKDTPFDLDIIADKESTIDIYLYDCNLNEIINFSTKKQLSYSTTLERGTYYILVMPTSSTAIRFNYLIDININTVSLPTSGYELPFDPTLTSANCYGYAINYNGFIEPGELSSDNSNELRNTSMSNSEYAEKIIQLCMRDAQAKGFTFQPIAREEVCPEGTYKIALVLDYRNSYHWYRQNPDGTWSHKPGITPVTNFEDNLLSDDLIYDPLYANRNYSIDYSYFAGYFAVSPVPTDSE